MASKYTALIFTCNRLTDLKGCFSSVAAQTVQPTQTIIVDNASTDGTQQWLESSKLTWYENPRKHLSHLFNYGWHKATEDFILFLADDVEIQPAWVAGAMPWMEDSRVGAISGPLISTTPFASEMHRLYVSGQKNALIRPLVQLYVKVVLENDPFAPGRFFDSGAYSFGQALEQRYDGAMETDLLTTSAMLIRKRVLEELNGFDETFLFNHADGDLFLRMKSAGCRLIFEPTARAVHHVRMGPSRNPFIVGRDTAVFHRKHLRPRTIRAATAAAMNIAVLNLYFLYAAIAQRNPRQLQGIAGYLSGTIS